RAVTALLDLAAVGVEDPVVRVALAVRCKRDEKQLIEADAEAPIREPAHGLTVRRGPIGRPVDDHEVVAETMHLREADGHASCASCGLPCAAGQGPAEGLMSARAIDSEARPGRRGASIRGIAVA